jgi:hypothetical protein
VFVLASVLLVFIIIAPTQDWSRAAALALEWAALGVVVATSRAREDVRKARAFVVSGGAALTVGAAAAGILPLAAALMLAGILALAIPLTLVGGLIRLVRTRGVTLQVVAGSLAIYLLVGLVFAWVIAVVADLDSAPYFAQGTDGGQGARTYFSFTVLTTTGFGDLTPARPLGHALAVVEMLVGQLYLVTVIGVLVGSIASKARASQPEG